MKKILIANRGEIACRVITAAQQLGIKTVAIYSDADREALHCQQADIAVGIGGLRASESYLDMDKVLAAAIANGVDGIHPGYGFLSESSRFAKAVQAHGMTWIGPSPDSIDAMGDKNRARDFAVACGVPILPGSGPLAPDDGCAVAKQAAAIGYPLLVKAAGGGGGIGMRQVDSAANLSKVISTTQSQAGKAFGDATVYLERYIPRARHIEIQVFGYGDGSAVHLFERECSVQRRFQKVIEESPAPNLPAHVLDKMTEAAVTLTKRQNYSGAGTVEFLMDADTQEFYFLEMNTRIQVEHGVTEQVTGWDLVQAQLRFARGDLIPAAQSEITHRGASIECRIYAENPERKFLPSPGTLSRFTVPHDMHALRIDTGVRQGDVITPFYDPMIAKLIVTGADRHQALAHMADALQATVIEGLHHNVEFLQEIIAHPEFVSGHIDTDFLKRELDALLIGLAERRGKERV